MEETDRKVTLNCAMPINYQLQWEKRYVLVIGLANIGATEGKLKL